MQPHVALVGPCARDVTTHATDDGDATQPALIRRRTTWVDARGRASGLGLAQRGVNHPRVFLVKPGPLDRGVELRHGLPPC